MDSLPFIFCDAVCAIFKDLNQFKRLCRYIPEYSIWEAAARENTKRTPVQVMIAYKGSFWSYQIDVNDKPRSFDHLKKLNGKQLDLKKLHFYSGRGSFEDRVSYQEIEEIFTFVRPLVNKTEITMSFASSQGVFSPLLALCHDLPFNSLITSLQMKWDQNSVDLVMNLLQTSLLTRISMGFASLPENLRAAIEEHVFREVVEYVDLDRMPLSTAFFRALFEKPLHVEKFAIAGHPSFHTEWLTTFKPDKQLPEVTYLGSREIRWLRDDGAIFTAEIRRPPSKRLEFSIKREADDTF